jgi:hypothetical protein
VVSYTQPSVRRLQPLCALVVLPQGSIDALKGFSVIGSLDKSLRNYSKMWEQIRAYRDREGSDAVQHFKLNILGEVLGDFHVPGGVLQECRDVTMLHSRLPSCRFKWPTIKMPCGCIEQQHKCTAMYCWNVVGTCQAGSMRTVLAGSRLTRACLHCCCPC